VIILPRSATRLKSSHNKTCRSSQQEASQQNPVTLREPARIREYLREKLPDIRRYFTRHVFPDPDAAFNQLIDEATECIAFGLLDTSQSLREQVRRMAVRKLILRQSELMSAACVLATIPKRDREILIRAQRKRSLERLEDEGATLGIPA